MQEAALAGTTPWSIAMQDYLTVNPLLPVEGTRNAEGAYWVLPASDGWVRVGHRLAAAVGRVRRADAQPRGVRGRRVAEPRIPAAERRRDPHGRRGPAHRPHPGRSCSKRRSARHHGRRAAPRERVRGAPADERRTTSSSTRGFPDSRGCRSRPTGHASPAPRRRSGSPRSRRRRRRVRPTPASGRRTARHGPRAAARRRAGGRVRRRRGGARAVRGPLGARRRRDQDRVDGQPRRAAHGERQPSS